MNILDIREYLPWLILPLCLSAIYYYVTVIYLAKEFFRESSKRSVNPGFGPPIALLKPFCGVSDTLYDDLASFCRQDYPTYQVIFAARSSADPGIGTIERLIQDFPEVDIALVCNDRTWGANPKVNNLANAVTRAKYPLLLLADSDIQVESDYLQRVVQPFADERVGAVTCLYRSRGGGILAAFEAIGSSTQHHPGVLVARRLQGMHFAFGSTIVIRKTVLEAIGGFGAIADYLADDFQVGHLTARAGYRVVLSDYVVEHQLDTTSLADFRDRQIRWSQCVRVEDAQGYLGLALTYGTVSSLLYLAATGGSWLGWSVFGLTWGARLVMAWIVGVQYLRDPVVRRYFWLIPLRDCVHFDIWCRGFWSNRIRWRGREFQLVRGGKLIMISEELCS